MFEGVWQRFRQNWQQFGMMGVGPLLVFIALALIFFLIFAAVFGAAIFSLIGAGMSGRPPVTTDVFHFVAGLLLAIPLFIVAELAASALVYGGLMGSIVAFRRGEPVSLGRFWREAGRLFWPFVLLFVLLTATIFAVGLVLMIPAMLVIVPSMMVAPFVAIPLAILLFYPLLFLVMGVVITNLAIYPAYLVAGGEMEVWTAYSHGWQNIGRHFGEALLGGLVFCLFGLVSAVVSLVNFIPVLGQLAYLAAMVFFGPLLVFYFTERYEQKVRPTPQ